jgi:hypothetical protein
MSATTTETQDPREAKARKQEQANERAVEKIFRAQYPNASLIKAVSVSQTQFRVNVFEKFDTGYGIVKENRIMHSEFYKYDAKAPIAPSKVSGEPVVID